MRTLILFLILTSISNSVYSRELENEEKNAVEESIKGDLKDPFSAVFYHGDYPYPDKSHIYCGYYNAKNSYGAFVGKQLFAVMLMKTNDGKHIAPALSGDGRDPSVVDSICASAGYDMPVKKLFFANVNNERNKSGIPKLSKSYMRN